MAESGDGDMGDSWWGGWIQAAKEKSTAALEMVRKDLAEFGCTMQQDTGHAIEITSSALKDSVKAENTSTAKDTFSRGLNTFLEGISKALVVPPDDEGQVPIIAPGSDTYDRTKARIHAVQVDPGTYIHEPSGSPETYGMWCEGFDLDSKKGEISEMLVSKAEVRGLYTKLVPSRVSHVDFWRRYFYRLHQLDVDQARKEALMRRAERSRTDDSLSWDDDWSGDEMAEDSGSDWEKLPRPNQKRQTADSLTPSRSPSPPPRAPTTPQVSDPNKDSENAAKLSAEASAAQPDSGAQGGFHEISLEVKKQSQESEIPPSTEKAIPPAEPEASSVVTGIVQPLLAGLMSPVEETCGGPLQQQQSGVESFKDYLKLSGDELGADVSDTQLGQEQPTSLELSPEENTAPEAVQSPVDVKTPQPAVLDTQVSGTPETTSPNVSLPEVISPTPETAQLPAGAPADQEPQLAPAPSLVPETALSVAVSEEGSTLKTTEKGASSLVPETVPTAAEVSAVQQALSVAVSEEGSTLKTTEKGDLVVVGSDHGSPLSNTSGSKGVSDVDDDWEQDLDLELTEEEMKAAEELAKKMGENINLEDDDWENWE
ncbi:BSD domain-containing protein 1-like isoform X2 [Littorina saxatilis]|uniref:BSD domain-containing protein n=1 Tax=Littorina saxatilis TaxID=31220 RepID=A0AAN9GBU4_9CAEN